MRKTYQNFGTTETPRLLGVRWPAKITPEMGQVVVYTITITNSSFGIIRGYMTSFSTGRAYMKRGLPEAGLTSWERPWKSLLDSVLNLTLRHGKNTNILRFLKTKIFKVLLSL